MGYLYVFMASVFFGISPTLSALLQNSGWSNGAVLLNNELFGALYLYVLIRSNHVSFRISRKELAAAAVLCGGAFWGTNIFLQISYHYLSNPGIATVLHFTYPIFVMLAMMLFFKERPTWLKLVCIAAASLGIVLIAGVSEASPQSAGPLRGALAAIASGAAYAVYIVSNEKSPAKTVQPLVFTFYVLLGGAVFNMVYLLFVRDFSLNFEGRNLICAIAVPLCSFSGLVTIAEGIHRIGPTRAAVINMMEPVVSMIVSLLVFQSGSLTVRALCGGGLILFSTGVIAVLNNADERPACKRRKKTIRKDHSI